MQKGIAIVLIGVMGIALVPAQAAPRSPVRMSAPHGMEAPLSLCALRSFEVFGFGRITSWGDRTELIQGGGTGVHATRVTIELQDAADSRPTGQVKAYVLGRIGNDGTTEIGVGPLSTVSASYFFLHRAGDYLILTRQGLFGRRADGKFSNAGAYRAGIDESSLRGALLAGRSSCRDPVIEPTGTEVQP